MGKYRYPLTPSQVRVLGLHPTQLSASSLCLWKRVPGKREGAPQHHESPLHSALETPTPAPLCSSQFCPLPRKRTEGLGMALPASQCTPKAQEGQGWSLGPKVLLPALEGGPSRGTRRKLRQTADPTCDVSLDTQAEWTSVCAPSRAWASLLSHF